MAIYLHESYKESVIRIYDEPDGYPRRLPYVASLTVDYLTNDTAYISNLMGRMSRSILRRIKQYLRQQGVTTLVYERHGKLKTETL